VTEAAPEVLAAFQAYSWPGNVRELENVIERAVILNSKSRIMVEDIPQFVKAPQGGGALSLDEMERRHIVQVLQETKGNVKAAAGVLGIDRKTLYRKAAEYGIDIVRE
jgi:two-component system, NtrC family, response regulator AtoC